MPVSDEALHGLVHVIRANSLSTTTRRSYLAIRTLTTRLGGIRRRFNFHLFQHSGGNLALATRNARLAPCVSGILITAQRVRRGITTLGTPKRHALGITLGAALSRSFGQHVVKHLFTIFPSRRLRFSCTRSVRGLDGLGGRSFSLTILVNPRGPNVPDVLLPSIRIRIINTRYNRRGSPLILLNSGFRIHPTSSYPCSRDFLHFLSTNLNGGRSNRQVVCSYDRALALSLVPRVSNVNVISHATTRGGNLAVFPNFRSCLRIHLTIGGPRLSDRTLDSIISLHLRRHTRHGMHDHPGHRARGRIFTRVHAWRHQGYHVRFQTVRLRVLILSRRKHSTSNDSSHRQRMFRHTNGGQQPVLNISLRQRHTQRRNRNRRRRSSRGRRHLIERAPAPRPAGITVGALGNRLPAELDTPVRAATTTTTVGLLQILRDSADACDVVTIETWSD